MPVTINILLGANTFEVGGDVPDLVPVVDLFRIWVNAQQGEASDPATLAALTDKLKGQNDALHASVTSSQPT